MNGHLNDVPDEEDDLADLRWHWDLAYEINLYCETWTARFLAGADMLSAISADDLRLLIRADYTSRTAVATSGTGTGTGTGTGGVEAGPGVRALRRLRDQGVI